MSKNDRTEKEHSFDEVDSPLSYLLIEKLDFGKIESYEYLYRAHKGKNK